jgi:Mg2+/Co2+ transporter CorB
LFDIVWTGFTVLWFAQILPKHMAATNPDRYLGVLRRPLFPVVDLVRKAGVSKPAEAVASVVERRLDWPLTSAQQIQESVLPREESLGHIWRELIPETPPASGAPDARDQGEPGRTGE